MKFEAYLVTESRRQLLTQEEFMTIAKGRCSDAFSEVVKNGVNLLRGIQNEGHNKDQGMDMPRADFFSIDPSKFKRVSNYASNNLYTLMFDNMKSWKSYPKRSRSVICGTAFGKANRYVGEGLFHVLPENGADIAIAPTQDLWASFTRVFDNYSEEEVLGGFAKSMYNVLSYFNKTQNTDVDNSWSSFRKNMVLFDKGVAEYMEQDGRLGVLKFIKDKDLDWFGTQFKDFIGEFYTGNMMRSLDKAFNPTANKFSIIKAGQRAPKGREAWTSNYCLMLNESFDINQLQL